MTAADEEPAPKQGQEIVDVFEDVIMRQALGLEKYKTRLMTFNGRNAAMDAPQENIDGAMYAKQALMEREYLRSIVEEARLMLVNGRRDKAKTLLDTYLELFNGHK